MRSLSRAGDRPQPVMNVTPLVDVVLVLLIIFMVVTPMLAKQFWIHMPNKPKDEPQQQVAEDNKTIVVRVTSAGEIKINHDVIAKDKFQHKLKRVLAGTGQRTVFFDADEDAEFGLAVEVMDLARAGGAATIAVLTEALKD